MYTLHKLSKSELQPIWDEVNSLYEDFGPRVNHKRNLVECKTHVDHIVAPLVAAHNYQYKWPESCSVIKARVNLRLEDLWVNYMSAGQAQPIHRHGGVMSFCIWLQVPYTRLDEQRACPWIPPENLINGEFALHTINNDEGIRTIPLGIDQHKEGMIALWPAYLHHSVFPFYSSNALRISVAGNYYFDV